MATTRSTRSQARKQSPTVTNTPAKSRPKALSNPDEIVLPSITITKKKGNRGKVQEAWCICRGPDDKTPMIRCECCKDWFHFSCINLSERNAEEIELYVCEACHCKTGQSTVYEWEGPDVIHYGTVDVGKLDGKSNGNGHRQRTSSRKSSVVSEDVPDEEDGNEGEQVSSSDDYKEEHHDDAHARNNKGPRRIVSSDEEGDGEDDAASFRGSRVKQLKRKRGKETQSQRKRARKPTSDVGSDNDVIGESKKKSKSNNDTSELDPARKYCLEALREVLLPIFMQFAKATGSEAAASVGSEDEKKTAEDKTATYVRDLERCIYDLYAELDKRGRKVTGAKYRERLRMLKFNLSQPDRYQLRNRIGTQEISPLELSKMSSVDLANEQQKQQIEAANRESLEHSILKEVTLLPRAKITHKGEEVIEDLEGEDVGRRIREQEQREREREREREKLARDRARSLSGPQDILAHQQNIAAARAEAQKLASIESPSVKEPPPEPAFKFDDLITMDNHGSPTEDSAPPAGSFIRDNTLTLSETSPQPPIPTSTASFDLNNVWSSDTATTNTPVVRNKSASPVLPRPSHDTPDAPTIELEINTGAHDEDFDMFLEDKVDATSAAPLLVGAEAEKALFISLPVVWSGSVDVPDVGKTPIVQARQIGGRTIESISPQWQTLFPPRNANQLRVEGRVPVKDSAKYLTQNRLNVTRELVVIALTPTGDRTQYDEIITFLLNRDRHAVVLPWGPNVGPDSPGKELYLIPVLPDVPLPDYLELLDIVKFPKQREEKMLLGVFILNKGKFSAMPPPLLTSVSSSSVVPTSTSSTGLSPPTVSSVHSLPATAPEIINKLTKEQIDSFLQTVLANGTLGPITGIQSTTPTNSLPSQSPPIPSIFPPAISSLLPTHSTTVGPTVSPPGSTASYLYGPMASPSYPPRSESVPTPYGYSSSGSPFRDHDQRSLGNRHTGQGDHRGRGRQYERGGQRSHGGYDDPTRLRDSGWGGRGRGRGGTS